MLKFRRTTSIKAKRASDRQRKSFDEKVKMDWAWMPLAAVMNEKATDLIYWVPPLYTTKVFKRGSHIPSRSSTSKSSIRRASSRRSTIRKSSSFVQVPPKRKRKLCQRRVKLRATNSVLGEMEPDAELTKTSLTRQEALDSHSVDVEENKSESEKSADESLIPFPEVRQTRSNGKHKSTESRTPNYKLKMKHASNLLKLLEKLTNMYNKRNSAKSISRTKSKIKCKKRTRPSVKLYRAPSQRLPAKRDNISVDSCNQFLPTLKPHKPTKIKRANTVNDKKINTDQVNDADKKENNSHNEEKQITQLQLALTILANYYEKKIEAQNYEMELMKMKIQRQEKVLKHTAQLSLQMKNNLTTVNARLDNIEHIGAKIYRQEEYFMPYVSLQSFNEENTSDSGPESCDESNSQSSSHVKVCPLPRPKLYVSHCKDSDTCEFREKYRTSIKLQINSSSISD